MKIVPFRGDARNDRVDLVLRRDIALPRGVWRRPMPEIESDLFILVTSDGFVGTALLPTSATDDERDALRTRFHDQLDAVDPADQPAVRVATRRPGLTERTRRVLSALGFATAT